MMASWLAVFERQWWHWPAMLGQADMAGTAKDLVDMSREAKKSPASSTHQYVILLAAIGLTSLLLLGLTAFQRRRKIRRRKMLHRSPWPSSASKNPGSAAKLSSGRRRRKRRHERPMNPTLAQTGGLPPARPADEPPRG